MTRFLATQSIVDYVRNYALSVESEPTVEKAKLLVLDFLGVVFAGARTEGGRSRDIASLVARDGERAAIIGTACRASASNAALVNGYSGHLLEFDDATLSPVGHPTATILPAVLALAQERGLSGRAVLESYLVGLEVHSRLGQAEAGNWSQNNSWLPLGHIGLIGAATAAARLLSLDESSTTHCIGLAAHFAGQLNVSNGSMAKPFGAGHSARCAIQAAELAEIGVTGPRDVIERVGGFADTFLDGADGLEKCLSRLGGPSHLEEIGVAIKQYPSCYGTHWSIDAMREVMESHELSDDQIRSVVLTYPADSAFLDNPFPSDVEGARFSLQYGLAACMVEGYPGLETYGESRLNDEDIQSALRRVRAFPHPAETASPASWTHEIRVEIEGGAEYVHSVKRPRGHPRNPLSSEEIINKFFASTSSLGGEASENVAQAVLTLDRTSDINRVISPLSQ